MKYFREEQKKKYAFVLYEMFEKFIKNVFPLLITNTFPSFYQAFGIFKIKIH